MAGVLLTGLASASIARAHESRPAYLQIEETTPGHYTVLWRTPTRGGMPLAIVLQFPEGVSDLREPVVQELSDSRLERRWIDAGPSGLADAQVRFLGLEFTITDVVVRVELLDGRSWVAIARPSQPWVEIAAVQGTLATVVEFVRQGIEHILSGPDHLLFVFGLLLLVGTPWMLVKTITSFTVAHSLTLAAATLGYVQLPPRPIEAAIALSILFLGLEIIRAQRGGTSVSIRHPWIVAFAFGLLHGFGFAGAMSTAGLPANEVPLALVSFNVGVELGQLVFVAFVLLLARAVQHVRSSWPRPVEQLPAYVVGSLGAFWTIQRIALMW